MSRHPARSLPSTLPYLDQPRRLGAGGAVLEPMGSRAPRSEHRVLAGAGGAVEQRRPAADRSRRAHQHRCLDAVAADHPARARRPGAAHPLEAGQPRGRRSPSPARPRRRCASSIPIAVALQRQATRSLSKRDLATLKRVLRQHARQPDAADAPSDRSPRTHHARDSAVPCVDASQRGTQWRPAGPSRELPWTASPAAPVVRRPPRAARRSAERRRPAAAPHRALFPARSRIPLVLKML